MQGNQQANAHECLDGFCRSVFQVGPDFWNHEINRGRKQHAMPNKIERTIGDELSEYGCESP